MAGQIIEQVVPRGWVSIVSGRIWPIEPRMAYFGEPLLSICTQAALIR